MVDCRSATNHLQFSVLLCAVCVLCGLTIWFLLCDTNKKTAAFFWTKGAAAYKSNFPPIATGCVAARRAKVRRASAQAVKATLAHANGLAPPSEYQAGSSIPSSSFTNTIGFHLLHSTLQNGPRHPPVGVPRLWRPIRARIPRSTGDWPGSGLAFPRLNTPLRPKRLPLKVCRILDGSCGGR